MKLRFWNTLTGTLNSEIDTGSQICNLMWSKNSNEVVSTHGFSAGQAQNQGTLRSPLFPVHRGANPAHS